MKFNEETEALKKNQTKIVMEMKKTIMESDEKLSGKFPSIDRTMWKTEHNIRAGRKGRAIGSFNKGQR